MSNSYLTKFRTSLPSSQGNRILKRLITKKDSGEIRTVDEFKDKLKELTADLLAERIKPTLKIYKAITGEDISSEQFNEMLDRIQDDLETAFAEADTIDTVSTAHHNLINGVALKALRYGINELESKITFYEFINKSGLGFDDVLFNTFRESQTVSTSRADQVAAIAYIDPRTKTTIDVSQDAAVDFIGERLTLGTDDFWYIEPRSAEWLNNSYSQHGELTVSFPTSSIRNIIDGQKRTYWVAPVLFSKIRTGGAYCEVCLYLPAAQDVNFIEIEPASDFPMYLVQIDYYDTNGDRQVADTTERLINAPMKAFFNRFCTSALILRFRQDNYRETQFKEKIGESNFHRALLGDKKLSVDMEAASDDLKEILSSDFLLSDIMSVPENTRSRKKYYQYVFGFDNIRPGYSTYDEQSIFVSKKKTVIEPGEIGLKADETRPTSSGSTTILLEDFTYPTQTTSEDGKFYYGSIEYWLTIQSYTDDGFLIATDTIPILPLYAKRIYHERLVFTRKESTTLLQNNMASLMFWTDNDEDDVKVYKNGILLVYGSSYDWQFVTNAEDSNITVDSRNSGSRMRRGVKINAAVNSLDIYTVSYTPKLSNTKLIPVEGNTLIEITDLSGDQRIRMIQDNIIVMDEFRSGLKVALADIYLTIILRRNTARLDLTPAVEEYMLTTGSRKWDKFLKDYE